MRYKDFEGSIEELIDKKLAEAEEKEQIRILYAVESGSRAWGFASPDSDYDVRFIYVRPISHYLKLQNKQDYIELELDKTLDIVGWDLSKVLQNTYKANATMFEWGNSPVVYKTTKEWERIYDVMKGYFSQKAAMYHYYGTANSNYHAYLLEDMVKYKKYLYVLRPILAYEWIAERKCSPPVLFSELTAAVLEEQMQQEVAELLAKKIQMSEADKAPRLAVLNAYIEAKLQQMKQNLENMKDDRKPEWDDLNRIFLETVGK